jgi:hypothetical protein
MVATNKSLARSNKTRTGFPVNRKREIKARIVASLDSVHDVRLGFGKMIQTVLKQLSIAATVLLASSGVGHVEESKEKQRLRDCLEQAYSQYHEAWVDACARRPGGLSNGSNCSLPSVRADRLNADLNTERNYCFQKGAAGL